MEAQKKLPEMQLTCILGSDNIIKVLPFILVTLEDMQDVL